MLEYVQFLQKSFSLDTTVESEDMDEDLGVRQWAIDQVRKPLS